MDKFWTETLEEVQEHIVNDCVADKSKWPCSFTKGMIVCDDDTEALLHEVKQHLHFDALKSSGKVHEITIDGSWDSYMKTTAEMPARLCWNNLVEAAFKANHGLLVINVSNIKMFAHCWHLKQLAKQERNLVTWEPYGTASSLDFMFDGYVLLNIKEISWKDVVAYAKDENSGEFSAMLQFYKKIY